MRIITCILLILLFGFAHAQAPGCADIDAGPDQVLNCPINCTDLHADVLETGSTNTYSVSSIPFNPPFPTTGGNSIFVGQDDVWSGVLNLPFNFCFYGSQKSQAVVGANGLITFDVSKANDHCAWSFNQSVPSSGLYDDVIMGAYHDIDPSVNSGTDISWDVLGAAPCRMFVVNYHNVAHFDCNEKITTQQIILYETTNIIEVYIHDKPTCHSWNNGNAVIGLQNSNGSLGITAPGRNTGSWSASNEAWRFTPSGPPNWVVSWYDQYGVFQGTGLDLLNVCPIGTTTYAAEVAYTNCDGTVMTIVDSVKVSQNTTLAGIGSSTPETCGGSCDGSITVTPTGGVAPFQYSMGAGFQSSPTFSGLCQGTHSVTITDDEGCNTQVQVLVNGPDPVDFIANDTMICQTGSATINPIITSGVGPFTYAWDNGETTSSITVTPTANSTYCLTVSDVNGCASVSKCFSVAVRAPLEVAAGPDQQVCIGESIDLTALGSGGTGNFTYTWSHGLGSGATKTFTPTKDTTVMVILSDDCESPHDTDYVYIDVIEPDPVTFVGDVLTGCAPLNVSFFSPDIPPGATCLWEFGDGTTSTDLDWTSHTYIEGGCFTVKLTVTTAEGCVVTKEFEDYVCPDAQPVANFEWNPELPSLLDTYVKFKNTSQGAVSYEWIVTVDGIEHYFTDQTIQYTFPNDDTASYDVCLIATNLSGCTDTICKVVKIVDDVHVFIPNAFSPNGDGSNDLFIPVLSQHEVTDYEFAIYDRWGQQLFYSDQIGQGWDGTYRGKQAPIDVYVYTIRLRKEWNNEWKDLKGHVTIVR